MLLHIIYKESFLGRWGKGQAFITFTTFPLLTSVGTNREWNNFKQWDLGMTQLLLEGWNKGLLRINIMLQCPGLVFQNPLVLMQFLIQN